METNNILQADLLDLVFDGRNKSYGAYELRRSYNRRLVKAMVTTLTTGLALAGLIVVKTSMAGNENLPIRLDGITLVDIQPEAPEPEPLPPLPPPPAPSVVPPVLETLQFTKPVLTDEVITPPPTQKDLAETRIGTFDQEGVRGLDIVVPPNDLDGNRGLIVRTVPQDKEPLIFTDVQIQATYIGDWKRFLERNLSGEVPIENGAIPGTYTVIIQFVVDVNGQVSQIQPLTRIGYGMEQEAMRVIRRSGKWKPAIQNGIEVKALRKQPVTFLVQEG
ncbi:energy transducer TonB [Niabella terrae]